LSKPRAQAASRGRTVVESDDEVEQTVGSHAPLRADSVWDAPIIEQIDEPARLTGPRSWVHLL
jgi:hypothetical protein